jgi:hypothetical protein
MTDTWLNVLDPLPCGCQRAICLAPGWQYMETCLRPTGSCTEHLCRVCGNVPLADSEPDRLCPECFERGLG